MDALHEEISNSSSKLQDQNNSVCDSAIIIIYS